MAAEPAIGTKHRRSVASEPEDAGANMSSSSLLCISILVLSSPLCVGFGVMITLRSVVAAAAVAAALAKRDGLFVGDAAL